MAIHHAEPGEVVDVRPMCADLTTSKTSTLFKTKHIEAIRIVLQAGKELPTHKAPGEIIVQCLEGTIAFSALDQTKELTAGQLLYLGAGEPHSLRCIENASVLVTILKSQ